MSHAPLQNLRAYLTVAEAADFLGVSPNTVRAWDAAGKLKARRNPANGYRLYRKSELEGFLAAIDGTRPSGPAGGTANRGAR
jgi:excisionase family DNA binding protein